MAATVQVTIDCRDPHRLAAWWADVLEWSVDPPDPEFIARMIAEGHVTPADAMQIEGRLVWRSVAFVVPPVGVVAPRLLFQWVPEGKTTKNRVHLDVHADHEDVAAARARVVALGAVALGAGRLGPLEWVTYQDPEGNEFCL